MKRPPPKIECPDRFDHDGHGDHCQHPVEGLYGEGWWLLCCICGCAERLRLPQPARKHGRHRASAQPARRVA